MLEFRENGHLVVIWMVKGRKKSSLKHYIAFCWLRLLFVLCHMPCKLSTKFHNSQGRVEKLSRLFDLEKAFDVVPGELLCLVL